LQKNMCEPDTRLDSEGDASEIIDTVKKLVSAKKQPGDHFKHQDHFLGWPTEKIKATFCAVAQWATSATARKKILQTMQSPWPENNTKRHKEATVSDAVTAQAPVIDNGSAIAQLFICRNSLFADNFALNLQTTHFPWCPNAANLQDSTLKTT